MTLTTEERALLARWRSGLESEFASLRTFVEERGNRRPCRHDEGKILRAQEVALRVSFLTRVLRESVD